ncbi:ABC transporter permease subunit [Streptomyces sp. NBC_01498]|uniref:ABC transporter permease n=1 Tax=Streptomyces sp. NBC_01498 TaxID=2975870 RepID=UPI002E7BFC4A|nr:ABC transporter permease [Streptomyces sp. NBC_01498]WTL24175.1 ABC transporter permease subunit [Streptomyces sp. NBC_01498]
MPVTALLHSEWIKIRSVRASYGSLLAVFVSTLAITLLVFATVGRAEADNGGDTVFNAFYVINFAQIAAISFGATAVSSEYTGGALRVSLSAVPHRSRFYASKIAVMAVAALAAGLAAGFTTFLVGQAFLGEYAIGLGEPGALRACFGAGIYLTAMALFAAGLTFLLRSAVAVISLLVPFILIVSFVVGDIAGGAAAYLPDRAGQQVLYQDPPEGPGPWAGLAVTLLWAAVSLLAGWWAVRRRDA